MAPTLMTSGSAEVASNPTSVLNDLLSAKLNGSTENGTREVRGEKSDEALSTVVDNLDSSSDDEEEEQAFHISKDRVSGYGVDERDSNTPDRWIKRHPELVRLTGKHPFNCEAPLSRLMDHGFITPTSLHYVRNHGAVPQCSWDEWRVEVKGLVRQPLILSMEDILAMPPRQLPVTLVCAGNRRKEENMVKQSIGFNWGAAGVSTSVWKGARMSDILRKAGILPRSKGALYVCFEGAEMLPGGGGSKYGTSVKREVAMDDANDILIAYEQNGQRLTPDHGFPVRIIIPGFIGGRMVKWLKRIEVTQTESTNYYHFNDNRVLPSHVDAEKATEEGWWYKPEYIINELNINSVITSPAHGEVVRFNAHAETDTYTLRGYAYCGGGRKIIRVEVSLDGGTTWKLCNVEYPEKPTSYGRYWCWTFWSLQLDVLHFLKATELVVRAWDQGMNTQPQNLTWNVMGMMNNCWFRVKVHPTRPRGGGLGLAFEHPTRPGNETGGWMVKAAEEEPVVKMKKTLSKSMSSPGLAPSSRAIPMSEVAKHTTEKSAWIVYQGSVYDCTKFLDDHPGGADSILLEAGGDATEEFDAIHSQKAKSLLEDYLIGVLTTLEPAERTPEGSLKGGVRALSSLQAAEEAGASKPPGLPLFRSRIPPKETDLTEVLGGFPVALNPKMRTPFKLVEKIVLSPDTRLFRFGLPSVSHVLGLPVGKHIYVSATVNGKFLMRAYTPTTSDDDLGHFDLVVKIYFPNTDPQFPDGGVMSCHLDSLQIGDTIGVKGPIGHIHYLGKGHFTSNGKPKFAKSIAMLAGGTGITPMYQVAKAILKDPLDETEVSLIFANRTEADILLRTELDHWASSHRNFKVFYVLSGECDPSWPYGRGYITEEMIREHLPPASETTVAFMCGPPPMIQYACNPNLEKVGYAKDARYCF